VLADNEGEKPLQAKMIPSATSIINSNKRYLRERHTKLEQYIPSDKAAASRMTGVPAVHDYKFIEKSIEQQRQTRFWL